MSAFTVRLPDAVSKKLDALAAKLDRSRSYVAAQAIEDFVAREAWQLADIEAGLRLTEHFLLERVLRPHGRAMPAARQRLSELGARESE